MKVCVVGGTGNISAAIVRRLLEQGHAVTCFNRGISPGLPPEARLIRGDRTDLERFEKTLRAETFDAVVDMMCFNAEQARSDLRAFADVGHLVFCSTVMTYGPRVEGLPITEDQPLRPQGPYGCHKAAAESVFLEAYREWSFPVTILRPSTTYGPRQGLIRQIGCGFAWLDRVRKGKPILVYGDGMALHQFLHVDDAAAAFVGVLRRPCCIGKIYHVVRNEGVTWWAYHRAVMRAIGREVEQVGVPVEVLQALDARRFGGAFAFPMLFDGSAIARDVPEFCPRISLEEGVASTLKAMEREGRIPDSDGETWEDRIIAVARGLTQSLAEAWKEESNSRCVT